MIDILTVIRGVRAQKKLSQQDVADRLGVDLKTYGNWERGDVELTFKMLQRIADAMEVPINSLWDPRKFEAKHITFHSARHTFASINLQLTENITVRRDLLGHDSVKSTQIYEHTDPMMLRVAMGKWDMI